jgi:hypothetical protein
MKIEISKNDLKETLDIANATLGSGSDITSHFFFEKIGSEVFISTAEPPRLYSSIPLKHAKIEGDSSFTVEGKRFLSAVNAVHGLLTITFDNSQVTLTSAKGKADFSSLDPEAFPPWRDLLAQSKEETSIVSNVLSETLNVTKPYSSVDDQRRPELCMVNFTKGKAFTCDGFGLAMAEHPLFEGLELKFHIKDVPAAAKFLKAHDGNNISILKSDKAVFLKSEDGALFGMTALPYTMPNAVTEKYIEAFSWVPRRVWRIKKDDFLSAIQFLSAGADETQLRVEFIHPESETLSPPRLQMPSARNGVLSYSLEEVPLSKSYPTEADCLAISNKGERLAAQRKLLDLQGETLPDIESFGFNIKYMKRALDVSEGVMTFGCNREGEKRGYMLFKQHTHTGIEVVCILGWMI